MMANFMKESAIILIHLLTINEISMYGLAFFKIVIANAQQMELNYFKLGLSSALMLYYLIYIVRLIYGSVKFKGTKE